MKRKNLFIISIVIAAITMSACSSGGGQGAAVEEGSAATESVSDSSSSDIESGLSEETGDYPEEFFVSEIGEDILARMQGKSYPEDCPVPLDDLRYLHILHVNMEGETLEGEMVVNKDIAGDVLDILYQLYEAEYPIERVRLIDEYDADDETSMRDNNSSSFCYRTIAGSDKISKHGYGLAVDINTLYNPYVKVRDDGSMFIQPETAEPYIDREADFPYKIDETDLCYRLFTEKGFEWGGSWTSVKDYQHFEK